MKLEQRYEQKQRLTFEQKQLLNDAKKSIGYIEYQIQQRTRWIYNDGKIEKTLDPINEYDNDKTLDVFEYMNRIER